MVDSSSNEANSMNSMNNSPEKRFASFFDTKAFRFLLVFIFLFTLFISASAYFWSISDKSEVNNPNDTNTNSLDASEFVISKFESEEDFRDYMEEAWTQTPSGVSLMNMPVAETAVDLDPQSQFGDLRTDEAITRVSETNVQVSGIDEPDILKTDGSSMFFSSRNLFRPEPFIGIERQILPNEDIPLQQPKTKIASAFPVENLGLSAEIDEVGEMLLSDNTLVIFTDDQIVGYDVSDKSAPEQVWNLELEQGDETRTTIATSRLYKNKIYLITTSYLYRNIPCPVPVFDGARSLTIACTDIYHPRGIVNTDATYTVMELEPTTGEVEDSISFIGSSSDSVVYMSSNAIYVTNTKRESELNILSDFFLRELDEILPSDVQERLRTIANYEISDQSKMTEYQLVLEEFFESLPDDEQKRIENEVQNRIEDYLSERVRDFSSTGINKITLDKLDITASGIVPGRPLNQFSLDEYEGNLRIATTSEGGFSTDSINDVYIMDSDLGQIGSVMNLGLTERIYAVRFLGDKGYVVTFRQIDPFYVLDLSNPRAPEMKGELKIPGFSSYLHPLDEDRILGVGREGSNVKVSIFDVSDPNNPTESDKYDLSEYSTEILNNHRAFLLDQQHNVFFMPAGSSGYIFDYQNGLQLVKVVADIQAQRALYINDYLYVVGDEIVVLDETTWEEVGRIDL